jgi:hypothetical protein
MIVLIAFIALLHGCAIRQRFHNHYGPDRSFGFVRNLDAGGSEWECCDCGKVVFDRKHADGPLQRYCAR